MDGNNPAMIRPVGQRARSQGLHDRTDQHGRLAKSDHPHDGATGNELHHHRCLEGRCRAAVPDQLADG